LSRRVAFLLFLVKLVPIVDEHVDIPGHTTLARFGIELQAIPGEPEISPAYHHRLITPDDVIVQIHGRIPKVDLHLRLRSLLVVGLDRSGLHLHILGVKPSGGFDVE
jgi:hypothetical protein